MATKGMTTIEILQGIKAWSNGNFYRKSLSGIPKSDLASNVQSAITAAETALQPSDIATLESKVLSLESLISEGSNPTAAIDKFNEIVAFLASITNTETLSGIVSGINNAIAAKQATLVSGTNIKTVDNTSLLGAGNLAVQSFGVIDLGAQSNFVGTFPDGYYTISYSGSSTLNDAINAIWASGKIPVIKMILDSHTSNYSIPLYKSPNNDFNGHDRAENGNYSIDVQIDSSRQRIYTRSIGSYTKPNGGIPSIDLASGVQASLALANSALQSHQDLCQNVTYSELVALRDGGQLKTGAFYRITDYVTTVSSLLEPKARSAGHAFDIIVLALDATTLSEDASAVAHEGDTYFNGSCLEAWKLKYRLDNVQWSQQVGTYIKDEDNKYTYLHIGEITLGGHTYKLLKGLGMYVEDWGDYALMDSLEEDATIYCYYGDPDDFDPEKPEEVGTATSIEEVTEAGQGTILWMKDEFDNECPYDFKNVQFKRYDTTDNLGRDGLAGKYIVADPNNVADKLVVEDTEDYIWTYTFSSDNSGGEQTDYSLGGHNVYSNVFKPYGEHLPNNVMFGEYNYANSFGYNCYNNSWGNSCYKNSWGNECTNNSWGNNCYNNSWCNSCSSNSWGNNCSSNSWGNNCYNNSWCNNCSSNSWGNNCSSNSWGNNCSSNSWGNGCSSNSWGNECTNNSWGNECTNNSWGNNCYNNSWCNSCSSNSWGNRCTHVTFFENVGYTNITTDKVRNCQVLNGVAGTNRNNKLTLNFAAQKNYTQVACLSSSGTLLIYVPGDRF